MGLTPGIKQIDFESSSLSGSEKETAKSSAGIQLGVLYGEPINDEFGWNAGASLFSRTHQGSDKNVDVSAGESDTKPEYTAIGIELTACVFYQVIPGLQIELNPVFGIGQGKLDYTPSAGGTKGSLKNGTYISYGFNLGAVYAIEKHWLVGAEVGYLAASGKSEETDQGAQWKYTTKASGVTTALTVGYRF